jgi:hypothetical protein
MDWEMRVGGNCYGASDFELLWATLGEEFALSRDVLGQEFESATVPGVDVGTWVAFAIRCDGGPWQAQCLSADQYDSLSRVPEALAVVKDAVLRGAETLAAPRH